MRILLKITSLLLFFIVIIAGVFLFTQTGVPYRHFCNLIEGRFAYDDVCIRKNCYLHGDCGHVPQSLKDCSPFKKDDHISVVHFKNGNPTKIENGKYQWRVCVMDGCSEIHITFINDKLESCSACDPHVDDLGNEVCERRHGGIE